VSVVAAQLYRDGMQARAVSLDEPIDCKGKSEFVWIGLFEPSERELKQLEKNYGLHPLAIEDAFKANQLPKVDVYGDQLFVMTRTAHLEQDRIAYGETAIFVGTNFIITVRHGSARAHSELRAQLEAAPSLLGHGPDYVLHAILDFIVDGYLPVVETIEEHVLKMEQSALDSFLSRADVKRLFGLRQELIRFQSERDHASVGRVGRDTGRADRDRRDLRHEFRKHAGVEDTIRLLRRRWRYRAALRGALPAFQTRPMALIPAPFPFRWNRNGALDF
jgi:Mg2+ and Co2+ transporter CorA